MEYGIAPCTSSSLTAVCTWHRAPFTLTFQVISEGKLRKWYVLHNMRGCPLCGTHTHTVQLPQTAAATQTDWEDPEVMQGTMTQEEREKALAKAAKAEKEKEKEKGSRRKKKRGRLGGIRKMIVSRKVLSGKKKSNRFPGNAVH